MKQDKKMNNVAFQLMSLEYKIKALFSRPEKILAEEAGTKKGCTVMDYGCGPGRYTIPLAGMVGKEGLVYAVDIHPLALKKVIRAAKKKGINNIKALFDKDINGIRENSIDTVVLYDTLHDINNKQNTLKTIEKLLKPEGVLSFKDHHINENEINSLITDNTSLQLEGKGNEVLKFIKK